MSVVAQRLIFGGLCVLAVFGSLAQATTTLYVLDDPEPDFGFGATVANIGDVNGDGVSDIGVASPYKEVDGRDGQGQVSVFSGAHGSLIYIVNHPFYSRNANFGSSIASLGDINGDGFSEFAVGASKTGTKGRVFVFSGAAGALLYSLESPSGASASYFGVAIAALGDVDGDAVSDFVVGDMADDGGFVLPDQPQGKAFMFSGSDGSLIRTIDNPLRDPGVAQSFGAAVAAVGDVNDDNVSDFVVGAWQQVSGGVVSGRAFVFSGADGALLHSLDQPVPQNGAQFGRRLASVGDLDGDSVEDIVVSAIGQDVSGINGQGQAYAFSGSDGSLLYVIDHPIPGSGSLFGTGVGAVGYINDDSVPDFAISANLQNDGRGQAYVLSGVDGSLLAILDDPALERGALFGTLSQVALGDLDGDTRPDLAVGASRQSVEGNRGQGRVFVFSISDFESTGISIDIKPFNQPDKPNRVQLPPPMQRVKVQILSTNTASGESVDFDALQVDPTTVRFGPWGASPILRYVQVVDKDRDGDKDLSMKFNTYATGISCTDTEATLTGKTYAGEPFVGKDSVSPYPCP